MREAILACAPPADGALGFIASALSLRREHAGQDQGTSQTFLSVRRSPVKRYAKTAAKSGSRAKISAVCVAEVNRCAASGRNMRRPWRRWL